MVGCAVKLGDGPFVILGTDPFRPLILRPIVGSVPKNIAYPFVYRLFDKIKENNGGG